MDVIEFLRRTDHRNLKYNIDYLVKEKLREYDLNLKERREKLRLLLESENMLYEEELNLQQKLRDEEKEAKRYEWIGLMRLDQKRNEEELLQIKQRQRELENSEEYKHIRSREMLLDSKQAQLYQIEEKKVLKEKQAKMEEFWLNNMKKFNEENEHQEFREQKLRKCIADLGQRTNLDQDADFKARKEIETEELRKDHHEENMLAWNIDQKYKKDEEFYKWRKKVHLKDVLERQIHQNTINNAIQRQVEEVNAKIERKRIQQSILMEIDQRESEVDKNRALQKEYLEHTFKEKQSMKEVEKKFDGMLIGTGCVLEQKEKRPYNKNSR